MTRDEKAKKAAIIGLLMTFPSSQALGDEVLNGYVDAVVDFSVEAVASACERFAKGQVPGRNNAFPPSGAELATQARIFQRTPSDTPRIPTNRIPEGYRVTADGRALIVPTGKPMPDGFKSHGGKVDFGGGSIDLAPLTIEERDYVFKHHGKTEDGRSMSGMTVDEIRAAINEPALPIGRQMPKARLQRL